jgi:hypothetical protein
MALTSRSFPPQISCQPAKYFNPSWYGDDHSRDHKKHPQPAGGAAGKHMVRPHDQAQKADRETGICDRQITKNWLAGMHRQNF